MSWDDWCSHIKAAGFVAGGIYGQDGSTWSEFCEDLLEDEDMLYLTLKEPASFRWLSLEGAVLAIIYCFPAVYNTLEHEAAKGNADAKGLLTKSNLKFAGEEISHINKCIQTGNPSAEKVCVNGAKQTVLKADTSDGILLGKNKTDSCLVSVKCNTCVVVGVGGKGSEPRSLLDPLTKLGNSLKEHGY